MLHYYLQVGDEDYVQSGGESRALVQMFTFLCKLNLFLLIPCNLLI